jgi:hypothetical protein
MSVCVECTHLHEKQQFDPNRTDEDDEEWNRHTAQYRDAWFEYFDSISGCNSTEGEILMDKWEKDNHPKHCCSFRHCGPW